MKREEKEAKKREIKSRISSPKSALIQVARQLEEAGLNTKAEQLSRLIGRLEEFQNSI